MRPPQPFPSPAGPFTPDEIVREVEMGMVTGMGRILTIVGMVLTPALASASRGPRTPIPPRVRELGRDEGLYRRLKWKLAQREAERPQPGGGAQGEA